MYLTQQLKKNCDKYKVDTKRRKNKRCQVVREVLCK